MVKRKEVYVDIIRKNKKPRRYKKYIPATVLTQKHVDEYNTYLHTKYKVIILKDLKNSIKSISELKSDRKNMKKLERSQILIDDKAYLIYSNYIHGNMGKEYYMSCSVGIPSDLYFHYFNKKIQHIYESLFCNDILKDTLILYHYHNSDTMINHSTDMFQFINKNDYRIYWFAYGTMFEPRKLSVYIDENNDGIRHSYYKLVLLAKKWNQTMLADDFSKSISMMSNVGLNIVKEILKYLPVRLRFMWEEENK
jgi:hypothetical protein